MSDDTQTQLNWPDFATTRNGWESSTERTNIIRTLGGADMLSLLALLVAWMSTLLFLSGESNWAIVVMFGGFICDKLDGYWARRQESSSKFGRQIDSFIDVFVYLLPGALLFHLELSSNWVFSTIVGFSILAFGGLRLVRHNTEGFELTDNVSYYHGTTIVHTNMVVVLNYVLMSYVGFWNTWFAAVTILLSCPFMISEYRAPKTIGAHVLLTGITAFVATLCLALEFSL